MQNELIHAMTETFEGHAQQTENGVEYWLARDLQILLGYTEWRNFVSVIDKAKTACDVSGHEIRDHFVDVNKTIQMPKNAEKLIEDLMLTRYACYLIAQNGDPRKQEIAFAQTYFAIQTRRAGLRPDSRQGRSGALRQKHSGHEGALARARQPSAGGLRPHHHSQGQGLRHRDYDPQRAGE